MALGDDGRALPQALRSHDPGRDHYFAFDVLELDRRDLRSLPLEERREILSSLLETAGASGWLAPVAAVPDGARLLAACEALGFEGVVSKRRDLPYRSGPRRGWVKVKCEAWRAHHGDRGKMFAKG